MTSAPVAFDAAAERYDTALGGLPHGRRIADALEPWLAPGAVFEPGVGTGLVAAAFAERGRTVAGVDLSVPMLARARQRLGDVVAVGDARALPLADATVDNVVLVNVLHLTGDVAGTLAEAVRVLRPGGRLVALHGRPEPEPTDLMAAAAGLDVLQRRPDGPVEVAAALRARGAALVVQRRAVEQWARMSPRDLARAITGRQFSYLMGLGAAQWEEVVEPVLAAVRALPGQDRAREQCWRCCVTVAEK
ncbi:MULTISPECIES: class I SAM-dependent methyltransferase [unclassified Streptomyces]|uniref:class I SAM-dependent methyltransferase n=1 Tax=unclassified Streptomyces TaxID=2593676 RepID=UPI000C26FC8A|nr:class I SAM-dependent methyltransferase [Streptomyces sp. CB02959]PJN39934.1 methyltransferase type 11 [Streptomyces sp. CB02959]